LERQVKDALGISFAQRHRLFDDHVGIGLERGQGMFGMQSIGASNGHYIDGLRRKQCAKARIVRHFTAQTKFRSSLYVAGGNEFRAAHVADHFNMALANAATAHYGKF